MSPGSHRNGADWAIGAAVHSFHSSYTSSCTGNRYATHTKDTWFRVLLPTAVYMHSGNMARHFTSSSAPAPRSRRHRSTLRQLDRRALERDGWRTTLEFRENHARLDTGQLIDVEPFWMAEAERDGVVISVAARSESRAWSRLLAEARVSERDFFEVASA